MSATERPSEAERQAFVDKLAGFRTTLAPREQRMLDRLVDAALLERTVDDVSGYWVSGLNGVDTRAPGHTTDRWTLGSPLSGEETRAPGQTSDPWTNPWHFR